MSVWSPGQHHGADGSDVRGEGCARWPALRSTLGGSNLVLSPIRRDSRVSTLPSLVRATFASMMMTMSKGSWRLLTVRGGGARRPVGVYPIRRLLVQ
eukprot:3591712-Pyramimonas_sp.AAC.1